MLTNDGNGMYLVNRPRPSGSITSWRGNAGSAAVNSPDTDELSCTKLPAAVVRLMISAYARGLGVFFESMQGKRKATGRLPGILLS